MVLPDQPQPDSSDPEGWALWGFGGSRKWNHIERVLRKGAYFAMLLHSMAVLTVLREQKTI